MLTLHRDGGQVRDDYDTKAAVPTLIVRHVSRGTTGGQHDAFDKISEAVASILDGKQRADDW
jgi:hypothetical protein